MTQPAPTDPTGQVLAVTNKDMIIAEYANEAMRRKSQFVMKSRSYHATGTFAFNLDVTDVFPTGGPFVGGYFVAPANQKIEFFGAQLGQSVPYGFSSTTSMSAANHVLEDADTNLGKSRQTNGSEDMIIESISLTRKAIRVGFQVQSGGSPLLTDPLAAEAPTDPGALAAFLGNAPLRDPASLLTPPQVGTPFNLEDVIGDLLMTTASFELEFNRGNVIKLGRLDQIPEGGRKGYNIAGGQPSTSNRYEIPEAYVWRRTGSDQDADFVARAILQEAPAIPFNAVPVGGGTLLRLPRTIWYDYTLRVHGFALNWPSQNAP